MFDALAANAPSQAVKEFSKVRLRKRAQSHILRLGPRGMPRNALPRAGLGGGNPRLGGARAGEAEDALYLIREEVAIMKKLNHPNLVQLIEVLDDPEEDSLYMVMEMCKKGVVMKVGLDSVADPYSPEACRCWFRDLILGIEYRESLSLSGIISE
jgi:calcium/calmodulin-dependent protein kinase kinase 2